MNILLWPVNSAWIASFVQGKHRYLIPHDDACGLDGDVDWPDTVEQLPLTEIRDADLAIVQRPEEIDLVPPSLPVVYVEHDVPAGDVPDVRHPMADRDDLIIAHVTHFNRLFWDTGSTLVTVIEPGVADPAVSWIGDLERLVVVLDEPVRLGRATGTDLFGRFTSVAPVDVFGTGLGGLEIPGVSVHDGLPRHEVHQRIARHRAYLHLSRWSSPGPSLIEAMQIGVPVLGLAAGDTITAVPEGAGVLSTRVETLVEAADWLIEEHAQARRLGERARRAALTRYGLDRFLAEWDHLLDRHAGASR